ncbi:DUF4123 domain-containing protein [Xanthomonas maliensis]|uniref:DUF4123 domain-containing protein n=1 Tax=Xanthomonas maliensis TaxID=1321368 RepID=UPI0003A84635|nr:DUF4123 domain-containing protein [Xanthomonas maliensis]KAB7772573.1 DUF4123 domain-containing protein [Xanthomonas maliensis]
MSGDLAFAYDRPDAAQQNALAAAVCAHLPAWAVLDMALLDAPTIHARLQRSGWQSHNAYAGSPLSAFAEQGVWLVALESEPALLHAQVQILLARTAGTAALSFVGTTAPIVALQALADYLGRIALEDRKQPLHCRFADTRVLPTLLAALDPAQTARVQATVREWSWIGRHAEYRRWQPQPSDTPADRNDHIRLTAAQFRALRSASDADAVFFLLLEQTPSLVPTQGRGQFHTRLCGFLQTAAAYRIHDIASRLQFAVLSLSCGEDFHQLPCLADTWAGVLAGDYTLAARMPLWGPEIWDQLEANAPQPRDPAADLAVQ